MWDWSQRVEVAAVLGDAFLAGAWNEDELLARAELVLALERRPRWLRPLVRRALTAYRERPGDRRREFHAWLDVQLARIEIRSRAPEVSRRLFPEPEMGRRRWPVPAIASTADLAAFLDLHLGELAWLADTRSLERTAAAEKLHNYRYAWVARPGRPPRLLECPKRHLKELQRWILHQVLDRIPPHPAAQGFAVGIPS